MSATLLSVLKEQTITYFTITLFDKTFYSRFSRVAWHNLMTGSQFSSNTSLCFNPASNFAITVIKVLSNRMNKHINLCETCCMLCRYHETDWPSSSDSPVGLRTITVPQFPTGTTREKYIYRTYIIYTLASNSKYDCVNVNYKCKLW